MNIRGLIPGLSSILLRHAQAVMPENQSRWSKAMLAEFEFVQGDYIALMWALGCIVAGYKERMKNVFNLSPENRQKILRTSLLILFMPMTILSVSGIGTFIFAFVSQEYANEVMKSVLIVIAVIGPIPYFFLLVTVISGPLGYLLSYQIVISHKKISCGWSITGLFICLPLIVFAFTTGWRGVDSPGLYDWSIFFFYFNLFPVVGFIILACLSIRETSKFETPGKGSVVM